MNSGFLAVPDLILMIVFAPVPETGEDKNSNTKGQPLYFKCI